jgi:hypothetical protein
VHLARRAVPARARSLRPGDERPDAWFPRSCVVAQPIDHERRGLHQVLPGQLFRAVAVACHHGLKHLFVLVPDITRVLVSHQHYSLDEAIALANDPGQQFTALLRWQPRMYADHGAHDRRHLSGDSATRPIELRFGEAYINREHFEYMQTS